MQPQSPNHSPEATLPKKRRAVVVVHDLAPHAQDLNWVEACSRALGPDVEVTEVRCTNFDAVRKAAEEAAYAGVWLVISIGGDGTAYHVINGIGTHPTLICPLPCGTNNELAFQLGFSKNIAANVDALGQFEPVEIDAMRANGNRFSFGAHMGWSLDSLVEYNNLRGKGRVWRFLIKTIGQLLFTGIILWKGFIKPSATGGSLRISYRDLADQSIKSREVDILNFILCGPPILSTGFHMTPVSDMADGKFETVLVLRTSTRELLKILGDGRKGTQFDNPGTTYIQTNWMEITAGKNMSFGVDGEKIPHSEKYCIDIDPVPIRVWAPKGKRPGLPKAAEGLVS